MESTATARTWTICVDLLLALCYNGTALRIQQCGLVYFLYTCIEKKIVCLHRCIWIYLSRVSIGGVLRAVKFNCNSNQQFHKTRQFISVEGKQIEGKHSDL